MDIPRILRALVIELHRTGKLELVEGASPEAVAQEVVAALDAHSGPGHLGSFVAGALISSDSVEELYVDDRAIVRLVTEVGHTA